MDERRAQAVAVVGLRDDGARVGHEGDVEQVGGDDEGGLDVYLREDVRRLYWEDVEVLLGCVFWGVCLDRGVVFYALE